MKKETRERGSDLLRSELANAAVDLIVANGYDGQTVDELARGIGISRATFFRYFESKDMVIVTALIGPEAEFADAFERRAERTVSMWRNLRGAVQPAIDLAGEDAGRLRGRIQLIRTLPTVGAQLRRARYPQATRLGEALARFGADPFAARILSAAAVAVLDQCLLQWAQDEGEALPVIVDRAFAELEAAGRPIGS